MSVHILITLTVLYIYHNELTELQKSNGHAGITREDGLPYVRSVRKVYSGRTLYEYKC